jgi:lipoprotein-anchoring transpeptidase ErfK/SrfK
VGEHRAATDVSLAPAGGPKEMLARFNTSFSTTGRTAWEARRPVAVATIALALFAAGKTVAFDIDAVNNAELDGRPTAARASKSAAKFDPAAVKAQVLLDRAGFSPGEIDGRLGDNAMKALALYAAARELPAPTKSRSQMWDELAATSAEPVLVEYTITEQEVKGPFLQKLPAKMEAKKDLPRLDFTSAREALAEKFHMSEALLQALNPGKSFDKSGETIVVANVNHTAERARVTRIEVNKKKRVLLAFDQAGDLVMAAPASIGSREKPAPSGQHRVAGVSQNPTYRYNPEYRFRGVKATEPFTIKPGPNNPVGLVWIGLSVEGYGIHGTPDPSKVSKTHSNGCIRLTNWDAKKLAAMIKKGTPVTFRD